MGEYFRGGDYKEQPGRQSGVKVKVMDMKEWELSNSLLGSLARDTED